MSLRQREARMTRNLLIILLFFISNHTLFHFNKFPINYTRLCGLILLAGLIIWQFRERINFKIISIVAVLLGVIPFLLSESKIKSIYFLNKKMPILTYDYSIKNATLIYHYYNELGENQQKTNISITTVETENLEIKNNQVFYKSRQLTFSNSNKIKPMVLNKEFIVFLSDLNRGIGFYELRKININE
jgi:hypothetical protein